MNLPNNLKNPFFAYGIFKPGQLCFFRIKNLVNQVSSTEVDGSLKERDGVPLFIKEGNLPIKGFLITFKDGCEKEAYERINEIEPSKIYRWEEIIGSEETESNILVGRRELRGSSHLEGCTEWDGRSDPFFTDAIDIIEEIIKDNIECGSNHKPLLRLQMAYSLLWSSIERYAGLRYYLGKDAYQKVMNIVGEEKFAESLKKHVNGKREIFSTVDLKKYTLDENNAEKSLKFYYQVRSNVVHRGKVVYKDFNTMKYTLNELLNIFKDLLEDAWEE